jgi:transcriptional regulator with XRE-family HTH domain
MSIGIGSDPIVVAARPVEDGDVAASKAEELDVVLNIAGRVRSAMQKRSLDTNELDRLAGLGSGYTSRLLNLRKKRPGPRTLAALASALRVDYRWLVTGVGEMVSDGHSTARIRSATQGAAITSSELNPDLAATVQLWRRRKKWSAAAIFVADQVGKNRSVAPEEWPVILDEAEVGVASLAATLVKR